MATFFSGIVGVSTTAQFSISNTAAMLISFILFRIQCPWQSSCCGSLLFIDWRPVDALCVWECHDDVVGVSGHFIVSVAALHGLVSRGACMSRCWNWTLTMMNVADNSRQQNVALGRNQVQQARETVITGVAATCGLRWGGACNRKVFQACKCGEHTSSLASTVFDSASCAKGSEGGCWAALGSSLRSIDCRQ